MRAPLTAQALYFLLFGLASGAAFTFAADALVASAELRATAAVFISMPLTSSSLID